MVMGMDAVRVLKRGAMALAEDSRAMRLESECWLIDLARGGTDWWLTVRLKPGSEPTPHDWYHLGWLVAALGAPPGSREDTYSTAEPFTWEWPAEDQCACSEWGPGHLPGCPLGGPPVSPELVAKIARGGSKD